MIVYTQMFTHVNLQLILYTRMGTLNPYRCLKQEWWPLGYLQMTFAYASSVISQNTIAYSDTIFLSYVSFKIPSQPQLKKTASSFTYSSAFLRVMSCATVSNTAVKYALVIMWCSSRLTVPSSFPCFRKRRYLQKLSLYRCQIYRRYISLLW